MRTNARGARQSRSSPPNARRGQPIKRWLGRLAPPLLVIAVVGVAIATFPSRSDAGPAASIDDCRPLPIDTSRAGKPPVSVEVQAVISSRGEQIGRRLGLVTRRGVPVSVSLASESFVTQPLADRVVYGQAMPGGGSEIRALSLDSGCSVQLFSSGDVVRSALLDPDGGALYVHTVRSADRVDGGVLRLDVETGHTSQALEPLAPNPDLGPVFGTQLALAHSGAALLVQSCGFDACLTRVLDVGQGSVATYDAEHGQFVGLTAGELIAFEAGHARPAALLAIDLVSGAPREVHAEALDARLVDESVGRLAIETADGWLEVIR